MPTIFRAQGIRFFFTSLDCLEPPHVHANVQGGEAKFWLLPDVALEWNHGLTQAELRDADSLVDEHWGECLIRWREFCPPIPTVGDQGS
jgi:Domain of unknown function (DUF4160)